MASSTTYEAESHMGAGAGLYANQNGETTSAPQHQHQHIQAHTDSDLQLQESLQQLQRGTEMMHAAPQGHQMSAAMSAAHHQFQTPPRPTHSPQQMAQSVMSLDGHDMYSDHDGSSRKRSKVSRACDECRRKKIRCDATSENGPEACSSCKRTGARCQFSRQPMKRGPSKGYIKELADRLNSLENQIQHPPATPQSYEFGGVGDQSLQDAQTSTQIPMKRTHSISEGFQESYNNKSWSGQDRGTHTTSDHDLRMMLTLQEYSSNGTGQALNRHSSFADMALAGNLIAGSNEGTIKAYYNTIHQTFPILPQDSTSLNRLTNCPAKLREAFFLALECGVRSFAPRALPLGDIGLNQLMHQCLEAVDTAQHMLSDTDNSRQLYNNLVFCQCLAFLTLASDKPGPGPVGNAADLLGRLTGRISELGLSDSKVMATLREQNQDSFETSRRLFWVAFNIDRFHASSRSKDIALPLYSGSVSRDDYAALGEVAYHLTRAADTVGQIAYLTRAGNVPNIDPSSPFAFAALTATSPSSLYLNGQLSRYRESLDLASIQSNSPPQLAYQYLRILVARLSAQTNSNETLAVTKELLGNLMTGTITPLHHTFATLVATSLTELSDRVETQVEAHASMREMIDAIGNGQIIHRSADGLGWDTAIRELLQQKRDPTPSSTALGQTSPTAPPNMAGLQHLAAAAVGERENVDVRPASSGGNGVTQSGLEHDTSAAVRAATEAAKAQATAAAAQKQLQGNSNGGNYDPSALVKDGLFAGLT